MSAGILTAIAVVLAVISALLSAIETALFSLQPFQIRRLNEKNPQLSQAIEKLMENPRRLLSAILFADSIANLPLILLCIFLMRHVFSSILPFWVTAFFIFAIVVFLCDLVPKLVALGEPYRIATIGVRVVRLAMPAFDPLSHRLQLWSEKLADALTPERIRPHKFLSEGELETLVQLSAEEGALQATESEMIQEIIKLGDKNVKDCMTPRINTFAIPDDLTNEEVIGLLKTKRYQRVPVYAETPDNILGILDAKTFLFDTSLPYTEVMLPPSFVPETMKALDLLKNFLSHRQGLAVIVDEFGGTEGIITLADIVEEIISDAVPSGGQSLYIEDLGEGRLLVNGNARLDDLSERLTRPIEAEGVDTIGGLVFNRLGYLPKPGATLNIEDLAVTVRRTSRKRIEELLLEPRLEK